MLDSYFFIPGDKPKFIRKIGELKTDFYVIDLEESVSINNKQQALDNVKKINVNQNTYVRIPFKDNVYSRDQLIFLIKKFRGRVVLPKVTDSEDLKSLISMHDGTFSLNLIVLVENPTCLVNLSDILKKNLKHIKAVGFGSHDFCSSTGIKHNLKHLSYYKNQLILISKAFGIHYIDGVDMNIRDLSIFSEECIFAFDSGADGKFIIHPDQLKKMHEIEYFSEIEIERMMEINKKMSLLDNKSIDVVEFDGKVYEKPHLDRIKKLMIKINKKNH